MKLCIFRFELATLLFVVTPRMSKDARTPQQTIGCMRYIVPFILLVLICGSANAVMYWCVDKNNGTRILRNYQCEEGEKQQPVQLEQEGPRQYSVIDSTGEQQHYATYVTTITYYDSAPTRSNPTAINFACEKRRKELSESIYEPTTLAGALVKSNLENAYKRDCENLPSLTPEARAASIESQKNARAQQNILQKLDDVKSQQDSLQDTTERMRRQLRGGVGSENYLRY